MIKWLRVNDRVKLIDYIKVHSFLKSDRMIFKLSSGKMSNMYFDLRLTTLSPEGQHLIGNLMFDKIKEIGLNPKAVGGLTMGADPVSTAVAYTSYLRGEPMEAFVIRKEPKAHGRGLQIEGNVQSGDQVVIVDDVLTTGGSIIKAVKIAKESGLDVKAVLVVLDRCEQNGRENVERLGWPVYSILTMKDFQQG
ncbi:MAG: orotate phosphoribosyltransferase [Thermodesulfovibrionales bacterium]